MPYFFIAFIFIFSIGCAKNKPIESVDSISQLRKFVDEKNGIVCYKYAHSSLSCVKVK